MTDERVARDHFRDEVASGEYSIEWTGKWRVAVDREWYPGIDLDEDEALSARDVARVFPGVTEQHARREIRRRAADGDPAPLQVKGAWLAPLSWWRTVIEEGVGEGA
jgi:hypothetical protein